MKNFSRCIFLPFVLIVSFVVTKFLVVWIVTVGLETDRGGIELLL